MPRKQLLKGVKKIVVKVGTSSITEDAALSPRKISRFVADVCSLIKRGYQVVIVSSGAITAGSGHVKKRAVTIPEKQALAAIGQPILINQYIKSFAKRGYQVGQILLTEDDISNRRRFLNARHTLQTLLQNKVIPIINENDSVVVKEIKFGDNDTLAAYVTSLIDADLLILLSDVDGFYYDLGDPAPVEEIYEITDEIKKRAGGSGSMHGTGGMMTKIIAASIVMLFGEKMIIANAARKDVLAGIMNGEKIGTIFVGSDRSLSSRKKWLSLQSANGSVSLDDGAVTALKKGKKSLLASGISDVKGNFEMGDVVELTDPSGNVVGKGVINYHHDELTKIKGLKTAEIKKILGDTYFDEVVHRDDLIMY